MAMTPSLKAMVEAMASEIADQAAARRAWADHELTAEALDLEKVAQSGLKALAGLPVDTPDIFERADQFEVYGMPILMGQTVFDAVLAEILKERP